MTTKRSRIFVILTNTSRRSLKAFEMNAFAWKIIRERRTSNHLQQNLDSCFNEKVTEFECKLMKGLRQKALKNAEGACAEHHRLSREPIAIKTVGIWMTPFPPVVSPNEGAAPEPHFFLFANDLTSVKGSEWQNYLTQLNLLSPWICQTYAERRDVESNTHEKNSIRFRFNETKFVVRSNETTCVIATFSNSKRCVMNVACFCCNFGTTVRNKVFWGVASFRSTKRCSLNLLELLNFSYQVRCK